ncbi:hypothetical protein [Clostridium botulinum]|nr:hypothetical protein [Clostridium botulinum]
MILNSKELTYLNASHVNVHQDGLLISKTFNKNLNTSHVNVHP